MKQIPLNTVKNNMGGVSRTILATYHKIGSYNVFEHNFPAILEVYEKDSVRLTSVQKDSLVMEIIPFDDYNHRLHPGTDFVGSVLPTWGNHALTNGWKLLEIYEEGGRNYIQGEVLAAMGGQLLIIQLVTFTEVWVVYALRSVQRRMMQVY